MDSTNSARFTVEDGHEPFQEYVPKVQALCHKIWPSMTEDFSIEQIQGGSRDRIIGITAPSTAVDNEKSYILMIPRYKEDNLENRLAVLRYVREHTMISVPDIIFSDATDNNPLGSPYIILNRIPGKKLCDTYASLSHEQRKTIAIEIGRVYKIQQTATEKKSGIIQASKDATGNFTYRIGPFPIDPAPELDLGDLRLSDTVSIRDTYLTLFKLQEASTRQHFPQDPKKADSFKRLSALAQEMHDAGLFQHVTHCLCHHPLTPRDIIVSILNDNSIKITGILGWSDAIIAPCFTACRPPSWLWDSENANEVPKSAEQRELKRIFEETVGGQVLIYAYNAKYGLATRIFELARYGGHGIDDDDGAGVAAQTEEVVGMWAGMKPRVWID